MDREKGKYRKRNFEILARVSKITLIGAIAVTFAFFLNNFRLSDYFPIKTVRVYGINRINQQEVKTLVLPLVNHGFFTINVDRIRERLLQMPWIADLYVRRIWPDKVIINLTEKVPVARFNETTLLSDAGEVFMPAADTYPDHLPEFAGPTGQQMFMLKNFSSMNRLLSPLHAKISYLELTPFLTWKLRLDNGITMQIGHKDILTRLNQFVKVYPKIIGTRANDVDYIDLRYSNGVAVRWKEVAST